VAGHEGTCLSLRDLGLLEQSSTDLDFLSCLPTRADISTGGTPSLSICMKRTLFARAPRSFSKALSHGRTLFPNLVSHRN
jgi:hypothetical protein